MADKHDLTERDFMRENDAVGIQLSEKVNDPVKCRSRLGKTLNFYYRQAV